MEIINCFGASIEVSKHTPLMTNEPLGVSNNRIFNSNKIPLTFDVNFLKERCLGQDCRGDLDRNLDALNDFSLMILCIK